MNDIYINVKVPEDIHKEIGKYLNNKYLFNFSVSSKFNYKLQKIEIKNRFDKLLEKYNKKKMLDKYCNRSDKTFRTYYCNRSDETSKTYYEKAANISTFSVFINIFKIILNQNSKTIDTVIDLDYIITLIKGGYKEYNDDLINVIFILMPWSKKSDILLHFLKKMIKNKIVDPNITNLSGAYPIQHAIAYSNLDAVKILIEYGGNIYLKDKNGCTVIDLNTIKNEKIYQYLHNKIFMK